MAVTQVMRQKDVKFADVLSRLRDGEATWNDCNWLWMNSAYKRITEAGMALFSTNKATNARNQVFYDRHVGEEYTLRPTRTVEVGKYPYQTLTQQQAYATYGNRLKFPFVEDLKLKVGVRVRCTRNIYGPGRVLLMANGNAGTVTSISESIVNVKLDDKDEVQVVTPVRSVKTQSFKRSRPGTDRTFAVSRTTSPFASASQAPFTNRRARAFPESST